MTDSCTDSVKLEQEIRRLQGLKYEALAREERERCIAIFGKMPEDKGYSEEAFAMVARVYVLRAHKHKDRDDKPDHEWIRLWHEYEPKATVDDLWEIAIGYIGGGCGVSG